MVDKAVELLEELYGGLKNGRRSLGPCPRLAGERIASHGWRLRQADPPSWPIGTPGSLDSFLSDCSFHGTRGSLVVGDGGRRW